jgi:hypothetical protein
MREAEQTISEMLGEIRAVSRAGPGFTRDWSAHREEEVANPAALVGVGSSGVGTYTQGGGRGTR